VRGALATLPGIVKVDVEPGNRDLTVQYARDKVTVDDMLRVLAAAKESAKPKE
jgi:allophanate hydrolase subunit 1